MKKIKLPNGDEIWDFHEVAMFIGVHYNSVLSYIAPGKAWERGRVNPETFQRDPAGNQSCPVKSGDQPEASLARTGVTQP
ncbi:MAG: hypothetical protein AMS17_00180 [Spirochaetes bacterium DG_61]|nr:MAG: hypothetical protein AMS17_00180 [Spirochaetes bacterium DG_61]